MTSERICFLVIALLTGVAGTARGQQDFTPPVSAVPFARIAETHEIDRRCSVSGKAGSNLYHSVQNRAKNNFTAKGDPVLLSLNDFTRLQVAAQQRIDAGKIPLERRYPTDRARLAGVVNVDGRPVGEGTLVTFVAYVFSARYKNTKYTRDRQGVPHTGESVNCDNPALDWNDIHLSLTSSRDPLTDECQTVTAEISPHYRPAIWSRFHDGLNPGIEAVLPSLLQGRVVANRANKLSPLRVRLTGQLFYDAGHRPCRFAGGKVIERHTPLRRSLWEIHPIYRIEVWEEAGKRWLDLDRSVGEAGSVKP